MSSLPSDKDGRVVQDEANWIRPTCKAFSSRGRGIAFGVWLDRRAELEKSTAELDAARTTAKILAIQLKSSRNAEEDDHSAHADLSSRREVLTSICEDTRAVSRNTELLRFLLAMTHTQKSRNQIPDEFSVQKVVLDFEL